MRQFLPALVIFSLLAAGVFCRASENLITDEGFEIPPAESSWIFNDWWVGDRGQKNTVEFGRDSGHARSGDYAMRVALKTQLGGNLQLTYPLAGLLTAGEAVQLRFWIRGPSNSPPISVLLDQAAAPWTEYWRVNVPATEEWREQEFALTLPTQIDRENLRLMFLMEEENVVWLDDVSLRRLPQKEGGEPLPGNRLANGSFETGRNRWYAKFQESGLPPVIPEAVERAIEAELVSVESPNAPHGRRVLRCHIPNRCSVHLTSAFFRLRFGHPAEIAFYARKMGGSGDLQVNLTHGEFPNLITHGEKFRVAGNDWQKYTFQVTPSASNGGRYSLELTSYTPGTFEFDGFTVREVGAPAGDAAVELGWQTIDDKHPGNIYHRQDSVVFQVTAFAPGRERQLPVVARVIDVWENQVAAFPVTFDLDDEGYGRKNLTLPANRYGAFKCEFRLPGRDNSTLPLLELVYHVLPKLPPLKQVKNSYFGGHFDMTPYNLSIAEKGGYRWLRMHPPLNTKWEVVEPRPGKFRFHDAGIKRAHAMGFKILGNLQATPDFYADTPQGRRNDWWDNWAPKEEYMEAYERYVVKTVTAFDDYIKYWEIWNEPDISFLNVPPGREKSRVYLELCRRTREALTRADLGDKILIGGAVTDNDRPFTREILEGGIGQYIEVFSFHHYSSGLEALLRRQARIEQWREFENRNGKPLPMWQTESGIYTRAGATWLRTSGRPFEPGHEMRVAAARTVQNLVFYKAIGVEKFFTYPLGAHPAGRRISRNDWQSVIDLNGIPYSPLPAHAVAVHFLEGAQPLGLETIDDDEGNPIFLARFERAGRKTTVAWSSHPLPLSELPGSGLQTSIVYDMMGNRVTEQPQLGTDPLYILLEHID